MKRLCIDLISDIHGYFPELPGGDLLILCGDYTAADKTVQWGHFFAWLKKQKYRKKILIGGNHDNFMMNGWPKSKKEAEDLQEVQSWLTEQEKDGLYDFEYLCDSGTEFGGLKIWGSPWTKTFKGINPKCCAFTLENDQELRERFDKCPVKVDILVMHGPPYGILDANAEGERCGSIPALELLDRVKPLYMVFGHIHEQGGKELLYKHIGPNTWCLNVSYVDEKYRPKNKVKRIYIPAKLGQFSQ